MHSVTELEAAVDQLHAVPLEDFVAERKRLAKELRGSGDRAAAAELAKLPKPTPPAWALNHLAREEPETVAAWLDAAAELRDATENAEKSSAGAVRAAIATHRDATRALLAAVRERTRPNGRELSEPMLDRVRDLLGAATADPELSELLRAGRIVEGAEKDEEEEGELIWGAELAGPAAKPARSPGGRGTRDSSARATKSSGAAAERRAVKEREAREREEAERAELERLVAEAEERLGELRATAEARAGAAAEAQERLEESQRTLHRSESEAAAAREAADEAAEAAEQAERELRTLTAKLSS
jgi:hypothetical protein